MSSLCKPAPAVAGSATPLPTCPPPPELERGETALAIDQEAVIVAAQPICNALFQWEPSELVGQSVEVLLVSGVANIRRELVPIEGSPAAPEVSLPRHFALARRKDGACFAVSVSLRQTAGCWWEMTFHDVEPPPDPRSKVRGPGLPRRGAALRRNRAQVAAPLDLADIPEIFKRSPAGWAAQPEPHAEAIAPAETAPGNSSAPSAPAATAAPPQDEPSSGDLEQRLRQTSGDLQRALAHLRQRDEQLHAASVNTRQITATLQEETARRTRLESELEQIRKAGDALSQQLGAEQQARAESEAKLRELEHRLVQNAEELRRAQAQPRQGAPDTDPDQPSLQDQLVEIESRLRNAVSSLARATAELESERGERKRGEAELLRSRTESARAARQVSALRRQLQPSAEGLHQTACRLLQSQLSDDQKQLLQTMLENILLLQTALQEAPAP